MSAETVMNRPNARWWLFAAAAGLVGAGALAGGLLSRQLAGATEAPGQQQQQQQEPSAQRAEAQPAEEQPQRPARAVQACSGCGVVEAVHRETRKGEASGVGAVAGGVIGGLIGNQMGGGNGKKAMTVVGAVGGGLAGNEIEKQQKSRTVYRTEVRMSDGSLRSFTRSEALAVGQKVRVDGQKLLLI